MSAVNFDEFWDKSKALLESMSKMDRTDQLYIEAIAQAAFTAGAESAAPRWRDMDSAPKDVAEVMFKCPGDGVWIGFWFNDEGGWVEHMTCTPINPIAWMPIPV